MLVEVVNCLFALLIKEWGLIMRMVMFIGIGNVVMKLCYELRIVMLWVQDCHVMSKGLLCYMLRIFMLWIKECYVMNKGLLCYELRIIMWWMLDCYVMSSICMLWVEDFHTMNIRLPVMMSEFGGRLGKDELKLGLSS